MKKEIIYNSDMHFEHQNWRSELAFWEDEIKSFKNRLVEIVKRWTDKNVLAQLEHFQNQFIRHGEVIDTLQHHVNVHETNMAMHYKSGEDVLNRVFVENHVKIRGEMETQRTIYNDLKKEFFEYLSKYM